MKTMLHLLLMIMTLGMMSCANEFDSGTIDEELQLYIDRFINEAASRDVAIDMDAEKFSAEIERISDRGVVGQCIHNSDGRQEVVIHSPYWNQIDDLDREYLVFHELGHCLLGRDHDDSSDNRGNCVSIMQTGDEECDKSYSDENRNKLIDELFTF